MKGPSQSVSLPSGSAPASAATATRTTENINYSELERDLVHQAPGDDTIPIDHHEAPYPS